MSNFRLGSGSIKELIGVHPDLVLVVKTAIELTTVDFSVHDGKREYWEQEELVRTGASKTMDSRHITGHAVDLVPYVNGKLRWEWPLIYPIAEAMRKAGQILNVPMRWGGNWDAVLTTSYDAPVEKLVEGYVESRRAQGKKAFIDGPHFELNRSKYP